MSTTPDPSLVSFNYFEALFTNAKQNSVLVINAEGKIMAINAAFTIAFGYDDEAIVGKHTKILFTKEDQLKGLPEREISTVLQTGQAKDNNYLVHKNNSITWVAGESVLVKNDAGNIAICKVIMDIHAQKASEKLLRQSNEFNESILASIEDVVIVLNTEIKIIKANKAFLKLFSQSYDVENTDFKKLIEPYDINDHLLKKIEAAITDRSYSLNNEIEMTTLAGDKRVFDVSCMPMDGSSNVLLIVHDITMRRYSERQREDLIGFVAHELRNPLANVVLCNDLMGETIQEKNYTAALELLGRSKNNVMRLNKMIAELYDATKVGSGNMILEITEFNFQDMVKEAIETIEVLHPDYSIVIIGGADILVNGDRHRLIQVITNYLTNGIKYSKGSSEVELHMSHDDKMITVSVKDKGLGISKEQLPYIFNRYFRAEKTKNLEGIGLGLYLSSQIIKAHHGNLWVESEEGAGSTFYFSIPV